MRMRKKSLNNLRTGLIAGLLLCGWGGMGLAVQAQSLQKVKVYGTVYDISHKQKTPLDFASVSFPSYAMGTTTTKDGTYVLDNVPIGKTHMRIQYLGKLPIDTLVNITRDMKT